MTRRTTRWWRRCAHSALREIVTLLSREQRLLVLPVDWLHMALARSALPCHWDQHEDARSLYVEFARVEASGYSIRLVPGAQHELAGLSRAFAVAAPEHATFMLTVAYAREPIDSATVARLRDAVRAILAAHPPRVLIVRLEHRRSRPGEPINHTLVRAAPSSNS